VDVAEYFFVLHLIFENILGAWRRQIYTEIFCAFFKYVKEYKMCEESAACV
jgi:hypothetical protein